MSECEYKVLVFSRERGKYAVNIDSCELSDRKKVYEEELAKASEEDIVAEYFDPKGMYEMRGFILNYQGDWERANTDGMTDSNGKIISLHMDRVLQSLEFTIPVKGGSEIVVRGSNPYEFLMALMRLAPEPDIVDEGFDVEMEATDIYVNFEYQNDSASLKELVGEKTAELFTGRYTSRDLENDELSSGPSGQ